MDYEFPKSEFLDFFTRETRKKISTLDWREVRLKKSTGSIQWLRNYYKANCTKLMPSRLLTIPIIIIEIVQSRWRNTIPMRKETVKCTMQNLVYHYNTGQLQSTNHRNKFRIKFKVFQLPNSHVPSNPSFRAYLNSVSTPTRRRLTQTLLQTFANVVEWSRRFEKQRETDRMKGEVIGAMSQFYIQQE